MHLSGGVGKETSNPSSQIQNWAVAAHLSKTGNFKFPLLLIATACITLLLHISNTHTHTPKHTHTLSPTKMKPHFYIRVSGFGPGFEPHFTKQYKKSLFNYILPFCRHVNVIIASIHSGSRLDIVQKIVMYIKYQ